jgi:ketosteroid isomerase-like protein
MNRTPRRLILALALCPPLTALTQTAQTAAPTNPAEAIFAMMNHSAADWNRGDIDTFVTCYKNSPDILFIGRKVVHGYDQMLTTYKTYYGTPEQRGVLTYTQLEVQPLDRHFATVTGHFHLERTPTGGGNSDGYFLLVVEDTSTGWKIVRDDTTPLPAPTTPAPVPTPAPAAPPATNK